MTVPLYTGTLTRTGLAIVHPAQPEDVLQFAIKSGGSGELLLLSGKTGRARVNAARTEAMAFVGTVRITMALTRTRTGWDALETSYDGRDSGGSVRAVRGWCGMLNCPECHGFGFIRSGNAASKTDACGKCARAATRLYVGVQCKRRKAKLPPCSTLIHADTSSSGAWMKRKESYIGFEREI